MQEAPLIDLNEGGMLERGIFPSLAENQKALWRIASNVEFLDKRVQKAVGYTEEIEVGSRIHAMHQAFVEGTRRAYYATSAEIFMYEFGNPVPTRIGTSFLSVQGRWSLEAWGSWVLATNEEDHPKVWKNNGPDGMVDLGGLVGVRADRRYRIFKKHKNHMLGYFGQRAEWSHESDVELWVPDTANSAGGYDIRDLDSDIVAVCPLGPDMAIYSGDSLVLQQYVGGDFYFGFTPAIDGVGALSMNAVVSVAHRNYGMSSKGFFVTDGISFEYIDSPQINRYVRDRLVMELGSLVVGLHDEQNETVKWWFPGEAGAIYGVGFNYKKSSWTILQQPVTAAESKKVFNWALIGTENLFGFQSGHELGTEPMETSLETFPLDAGNRERYKLWDLYRSDFSGTGLEVRFGFSDNIKDAPDWTPWQPLQAENWINRESVFLRIGLRSMTAGDWQLEGFTVHGEQTGYL